MPRRRSLWHPFFHPFSLQRATRTDLLLSCSAFLAYCLLVYYWLPPAIFIYLLVAFHIGVLFCIARRFHDIGASGFLALLGLIPGLQPILVIALLIAKPESGRNRFGYDPRQCSPCHLEFKAERRRLLLYIVEEVFGERICKPIEINSFADFLHAIQTISDELQKLSTALACHNATTNESFVKALEIAGHKDWADIIRRASEEFTSIGEEQLLPGIPQELANTVGFDAFFRVYILNPDGARIECPCGYRWINLCIQVNTSGFLGGQLDAIREAIYAFGDLNLDLDALFERPKPSKPHRRSDVGNVATTGTEAPRSGIRVHRRAPSPPQPPQPAAQPSLPLEFPTYVHPQTVPLRKAMPGGTPDKNGEKR